MCPSFWNTSHILSTTSFYRLKTAWTKDILNLEKTLTTVTERQLERVKCPIYNENIKKSPKNCKEIIQACIWKDFTRSMIPFLTTGKKKKVPVQSQGSLMHSLWILPNLLIDWQTHEWRQLRKTPATRLDMKGRWCVLSTQLVLLLQLRSRILVMKEFLQRRSYPSPQFPLSSLNSTQGAALKLCKNDIFFLWWLVPLFHTWQAAARSPSWPLHHYLPVEVLQPGMEEGSRLPGS